MDKEGYFPIQGRNTFYLSTLFGFEEFTADFSISPLCPFCSKYMQSFCLHKYQFSNLYVFFSSTTSLEISAFAFWRVWMFLFSLLALFENRNVHSNTFIIAHIFLFCFVLFSSSLFWGGVLGFVLFRFRLMMYFTRCYTRFLYHNPVCLKISIK